MRAGGRDDTHLSTDSGARRQLPTERGKSRGDVLQLLRSQSSTHSSPGLFLGSLVEREPRPSPLKLFAPSTSPRPAGSLCSAAYCRLTRLVGATGRTPSPTVRSATPETRGPTSWPGGPSGRAGPRRPAQTRPKRGAPRRPSDSCFARSRSWADQKEVVSVGARRFARLSQDAESSQLTHSKWLAQCLVRGCIVAAMRALAVVAILIMQTACSVTRTLPTLASDNGGCRGVGLDATLAGSPADPRVAWLLSSGGGRQEIVWPPGFSARFTPHLEVHDASGTTVFRAGDKISGGCVAGPPEDPGMVLLIRPGY